MKFAFRSLCLKPDSAGVRQFKTDIGNLGSLIPIDSVEATLDRISLPKGAFRLKLHLAVPGPDLRVESTGYTVEEAMGKVRKQLARRIRSRQARQRQNHGLTIRRPVAP